MLLQHEHQHACSDLHFWFGKLLALVHNSHERGVHSLVTKLVLKAGKVLLQLPQTSLTERQLCQALCNVLPLALIPAVVSCDCHVTRHVNTVVAVQYKVAVCPSSNPLNLRVRKFYLIL